LLIETKFITFSAFVGSWFLVSGLFWKLFERCEKAATDEARTLASNWMANYNPGEHINHLAEIFCNSFDNVFGERHLTWKCFFRSSAASTISVIVMLLLWIGIRPNEVIETNFYDSMTALISWVLVWNLLPDYLSLLQTRLIVKRIKTHPKLTILWLFIDIILTAVLAISVWLIVFLVFYLINSQNTFSEFIDVFSNVILPLSNGGDPIPSPGVIFYSTFFTSVWLWLYIVSGLLSKLTNSANTTFAIVKKLLFRVDQPFISLGAMSVIFITGIYLIITPVIIVLA